MITERYPEVISDFIEFGKAIDEIKSELNRILRLEERGTVADMQEVCSSLDDNLIRKLLMRARRSHVRMYGVVTLALEKERDEAMKVSQNDRR